MRALTFCFTIVVAASPSTFAQTTRRSMDDIPVADAHVHLLDFLQNGGYLLNGKEMVPKAADALPSGSRLVWLVVRTSRGRWPRSVPIA